MHPRKVRGGVRLENREGLTGLAWAGQRWLRLAEDSAANPVFLEGTQYARLGQTRNFSLQPGHVSARVQGRMPQAYAVDIRLPVLTHDQWELVIHAMLDEARHLAGLLAGEVPAGIEDIFSPLQLRLFPAQPADVALSCTCAKNAAAAGDSVAAAEAGTPWCKHVCCVMALTAERLSRDPFLIFMLRGLAKEDLLERLRQQRALMSAKSSVGTGTPGAGRPVPAYSPRIPGVGEEPAKALELCTGEFWQAGPGLGELDLPMEPPAVSHPLLRRLGPSPFEQAKFPLVGLLATCYETLSTHAINAATANVGDVVEVDEVDEADEADEADDGEDEAGV